MKIVFSKLTKLFSFLFFPCSAWTISRDISALSAREIEAYVASPHKKSGDLLEGYRIAADPTEWQREKDEEQSRWEEAQELLAAVDTEDQLASGGEEAAGKEKPGKKRKRKSEAGPAVGGAEKKESSEEKKAKKPKVEKPEKLAKSRVSYFSGFGIATFLPLVVVMFPFLSTTPFPFLFRPPLLFALC